MYSSSWKDYLISEQCKILIIRFIRTWHSYHHRGINISSDNHAERGAVSGNHVGVNQSLTCQQRLQDDSCLSHDPELHLSPFSPSVTPFSEGTRTKQDNVWSCWASQSTLLQPRPARSSGTESTQMRSTRLPVPSLLLPLKHIQSCVCQRSWLTFFISVINSIAITAN